jgi:hypothetical protein
MITSVQLPFGLFARIRRESGLRDKVRMGAFFPGPLNTQSTFDAVAWRPMNGPARARSSPALLRT